MCRRRATGSRRLDPLSDALEVPLQIVAAETQRGGPSVRTVVRVLRQFPLGQQCGDGFLRQPVARAHSGMAGHEAEQVMEQLLAAGHTLLGEYIIDHGPQHIFGAASAQQRRIAVQDQRAAAEVRHVQVQLRQRLTLFQHQCCLAGRQLHHLGDEQALPLQPAGVQVLLQLLEEDSFVQSMLVDK